MTFNAFDEYQKKLLETVIELRSTKGKEYANSDDRFANFNRLAVRLRMSPLQVALVYLTKHMDAIESYITNGRTYSTETIQGRISDAICYISLIGGMIAEMEREQLKDNMQEKNLPSEGKVNTEELRDKDYIGVNKQAYFRP